MGTKATTCSDFPNGRKATEGQIFGSEKRKKPKSAKLWESQSEIQMIKVTVKVRSLEIKTL